MRDFLREVQYTWDLKKYVTKYLSTLEDLFGPRDPKFVFGDIKKANQDTPYVYFPQKYNLEGGCIVEIHISNCAWDNYRKEQGAWQVAHECVHLIDPVEKDSINVLEEGLATWFQDELKYHDSMVKRYIRNNIPQTPKYREAKELFQHCLPGILPAIKSIRESGVRISDISMEILSPLFQNKKTGIVERLCEPFQ